MVLLQLRDPLELFLKRMEFLTDWGFLSGHDICLKSTFKKDTEKIGCIEGRDLARTHPACLLDRQFPENLGFGQAKISLKNF